MSDRGSRSCALCAFWTQLNNDTGACHGAPPSRVGTGLQGQPYAIWPVTRKVDWCGAYQSTTDPRPEGR